MVLSDLSRDEYPVNKHQRVLFVGNSLTYRGGGVDIHYRHLVRDCDTDRIVKGGAALKALLPLAEELIRNGNWDIVILQDDLPETSIEDFMESVRTGGTIVRESGARPVLLMTWPYKRLGWIDTGGIADAHRKVATETQMILAPAGLAWKAAQEAASELNLYDKDREHPSVAGSFLAACTLAASLGTLQVSSAAVRNRPAELSETAANFLIGIAEETVRKSG